MDRDRFVTFALLAFGMIIVGFITRALSRLVVDAQTATLIAAPLILGGFGIVIALTVLSILAYLGVGPLSTPVHDKD